ncbi:MAG: hypothetical protein IT537_05020 [Hyphomicrobiales bacterium]|nr:hypothetical protein [Hyphomicrobiales bacterium]
MSKLVISISFNRVALPAEPPDRFQIMPWGEFVSNGINGNPLDTLADEETFRLIAEAHKKHGVDTPIDYNHQLVDKDFAASGKPALILGHIQGYEMIPGDGIYATGVTWTPEGAKIVSNQQARYPSYVGYIDSQTGRVLEVHSIGLTPTPFIDGIKPVINSRKAVVNMYEKIEAAKWFLNLKATATEQEIIMNFEEYLNQMRAELSLPKEADATAVLNAVKARNTELVTVRKALSVEPDAKTDQVVEAVNALKAKPAASAGDTIPKAEFDAVVNAQKADREKVTRMEAELAERRANDRIVAAQNAGKLTEAMLVKNSEGKNHFVTCALTNDDSAWKELVDRLPVQSPANGRVVSGGSTQGASTRSSDTIVANSEHFIGERLPEYERIAKHAAEKNISFEKAMEACGAL